MYWVFCSLIFIIIGVNCAYADNFIVNTNNFNENTIIEIINDIYNNTKIEVVQIIVDDDDILKSFKTEKGWVGKKILDNIIVFTTKEPTEPGDSIKFDIKSLKTEPNINWIIIDSEGNKTFGTITNQIKHAMSESKSDIEQTLRIIPDKPRAGSTIRVIGENFENNDELSLYINNIKRETLKANHLGNFIITTKLPYKLQNEMAEITVVDNDGNKQNIIVHEFKNKNQLNIENITYTLDRNYIINVNGTALSNDNITIYIKDHDNRIITNNVSQTNLNGKWNTEINIPRNNELKELIVEVTDGVHIDIKQFTITPTQPIKITPKELKFENDDKIEFNIESSPNNEIEIIIKDPHGIEMFTSIINTNRDGTAILEIIQDKSFIDGTYVLYGVDKNDMTIVPFGIGEIPKDQLIINTDKKNYDVGSTSIIGIYGPKSSTISLLVIDQYDKIKFSDTIVLGVNGYLDYKLDLNEYMSGTYTIVLTRGNSQVSETFSVGLQIGSGPIALHTTKNKYLIGEQMLILGNSNSNIRIDVTISDSANNIIRTKEIFTNNNGFFAENSFRIPVNAKVGEWIIEAKSGSNYAYKKIEIINDINNMIIHMNNKKIYSIGDFVIVNGSGVNRSQPIAISIIHENEVIEKIEVFSTNHGEFSATWKIPEKIEYGEYKMNITDNIQNSEVPFFID